MIEYVLMFSAVIVAIASLLPKDLMKAVIIGTGIEGLALAFLFQKLLAPDVALTQAIICSTILPAIFVITVYKTRRFEE
ncbi:MAG: hydrogenase subunit MbhD domain-containing protein [Candidatus Altiarchaeota archaeon]